MSRSKRERVHRYYSRVISLAQSALDDGSQSPQPCRFYIEALLSALGYDVVDEWTRLLDEELASFVVCSVRLSDEKTHDRALSRIRKARERLAAWQSKKGNPILIEHRHFFEHATDSEPGKPKGKHYSEYRLPFGELVRDIVAECPVGSHDLKLKRAVKRHVTAYLKRFDGESKGDNKKREHSPESDLKRAATVARKAFEREIAKSGRPSAINTFRIAFEREFGAILHEVFSDNSNEISELTSKPCATSVTLISEPERADLWHEEEEEDVPQISPDPDLIKEPLGQEIDDFIAENFSGHHVRSCYQHEDWLSLAEIESFDSTPIGRSKPERRYLCPLCHSDRPRDNNHRCFCVNVDKGVYKCQRCEAAGKIREYCDDLQDGSARKFPVTARPAEIKSDDWRQRFEKAAPISSTPGAKYLAGRGVPELIADLAGAKFSGLYLGGSVLFPIRDQDSILVAFNARAINNAEKKTRGEKSRGVFLATPGALNAKVVAITEAPIDGLILAACGLDAIALCGSGWPDWLPDALAGSDVLLATDNDEPDEKTGKRPGDECAAKLAEALTGRSVTLRLRPEGAKDWAELAEREGLDAVRAQIAAHS